MTGRQALVERAIDALEAMDIQLGQASSNFTADFIPLARAIEAAHGIRSTGAPE